MIGVYSIFYGIIFGYIFFGRHKNEDRIMALLISSFSIYYSILIFQKFDRMATTLVNYHNLKHILNTFIQNVLENIDLRPEFQNTQTPEERFINIMNRINDTFTPRGVYRPTQISSMLIWNTIVKPAIDNPSTNSFRRHVIDSVEDSITRQTIIHNYAYTLNESHNDFISEETLRRLYDPLMPTASPQTTRNPFTNLPLSKVTKWILVPLNVPDQEHTD